MRDNFLKFTLRPPHLFGTFSYRSVTFFAESDVFSYLFGLLLFYMRHSDYLEVKYVTGFPKFSIR
jgi:hypothetical protein